MNSVRSAVIVVWMMGAIVSASPTAHAAEQAPDSSLAQQLELEFVDVAKRVGPAVVSISTESVEHIPAQRFYFHRGPSDGSDDDVFDRFFRDFFGEMPDREFRERGLGTGVIIDAEGFILTNEHVVHGADKVAVTLPDGREFKGQIKGTDIRSDLAVIKIDARNLPVARLGDSDQVRIGQWAIAVGNPFGFAVGGNEPTVTVGVISAVNRSLRLGGGDRDYSNLIQTDAAINPGNSGGPLVNIRAEVIGINVAIFSTTGGYQGIGFAIPSNSAKAIVGDLIAGKRILYGWMGMQVQDISEELVSPFGLSSTEGVIVHRVLPGSPAEKGGLKDGDAVFSFNGQPVKNAREFLKKVARAKVGMKVPLEILRDRKRMTVQVEIGERPSDLSSAEIPGEGAWRGLEVSALTPELAERYRLPEGNRAVVVTQVKPDSPADQMGIQPGDLILEINRRPIQSAQDFVRVTQGIRGDALVKTSRGFFVLKE